MGLNCTLETMSEKLYYEILDASQQAQFRQRRNQNRFLVEGGDDCVEWVCDDDGIETGPYPTFRPTSEPTLTHTYSPTDGSTNYPTSYQGTTNQPTHEQDCLTWSCEEDDGEVVDCECEPHSTIYPTRTPTSSPLAQSPTPQPTLETPFDSFPISISGFYISSSSSL